MSIQLSLVIPAYNEARRLPPFLESVRKYLDDNFASAYEVIAVDDGSSDGTLAVLQAAAADWKQFRVLSHPENRGKGAAVRTGMADAIGCLRLFADADGATPIQEEGRLRAAIAAGADVAIGSRLISAAGVDRDRAWFRGIGGRVFAWLARRSLGISVQDTQCGFKMFRQQAAESLFPEQTEDGYLFDLELLYLAGRQNLRIAEVAVNWSEQAGSHLTFRHQLRLALVEVWRLRSKLR